MSVALVQETNGSTSFGTISTSVAFGANNAAGNLVVAAVLWIQNTGGGAVTLAGVTDSNNGSSYSLVPSSHIDITSTPHYGQLAIEFAVLTNVKAGANTVTATFSSAPTFGLICVFELSGADNSNPVDQVVTNTATITSNQTLTSGSVTTTRAGEYCIGFVLWDDGFGSGSRFTAEAGWTIQNGGGGNNDLALEYIAQALAGAVAATFTFVPTGSGPYIANLITIQPPGAQYNEALSLNIQNAINTKSSAQVNATVSFNVQKAINTTVSVHISAAMVLDAALSLVGSGSSAAQYGALFILSTLVIQQLFASAMSSHPDALAATSVTQDTTVTAVDDVQDVTFTSSTDDP